MWRIKTVVFILLLANVLLVNAQNESEWKNELYGFIRADAFYDSRKSAEAVDGMFLLYPLNKNPDANGNDLNNVSQMTMTSISSRIGLKTGGKKVLNNSAILNARLEADFTARSNSNSLRLRHACVSLDGQQHHLLMGRTWHPMFTPAVFPLTLSINVGTPFNPFNRSPQLRYTYTPKAPFELLLAALYQNDYQNLGPDGEGGVEKRFDMMRNAKVPNLHFSSRYTKNHHTAGAFFDYKILQPATHTTGIAGVYKSNATISGYAAGFFAKTKIRKFTIKAKSVYGQNLSDHLLTGGYAVKAYNQVTGEAQYTPSNHSFNWLNIEYGNALTGGLLLGYSKNFGFSHNLVSTRPIYARGSNIDYLYRVTPYVKWRTSRLELWAETELTTAAYGEIQYNHKGQVKNTTEITNMRIQFSCVYLIL